MNNTCKCGISVPSYQGDICVVCQDKAAILVATIKVDNARNMDRMHESASAYHTIRVEPGNYPVEVKINGRGERRLTASFTGKILSSGYGNKAYRELEGTTDTVKYNPRKYELLSGSYWGEVTILDEATINLFGGV
jgi:hypothetical protein